MELYFIVFLFGFVCARGFYDTGDYYDFHRIDSIRHEPSCLAAGGLCTIATDCPKGQLTEEKGLCPQQQSEGIECCNGMSVKETRCLKRGGQCMAINCSVVFKQASDCNYGTRCCILV